MLYFDTDAFRKIGAALAGSQLSDTVKAHISVSPITAIEVLSQLSVTDSEKILADIRAMKCWLPDRAGILDWPDVFIAENVFGERKPNEDFRHIAEAFDACLEATSAEQVKDAGKATRDLLDRATGAQAQRNQSEVELLRSNPLDDSQLAPIFAQAMALRVEVEFKPEVEATVLERLNAYFEYQNEILRRAVANTEYNFEKHRSRALDAEQLVFLADPALHFVTADHGFECITRSQQRARIHILQNTDLTDSASITAFLTSLAPSS